MFGGILLISLSVFPVIYAIGYGCEKFLIGKDLGSIGNTCVHILFFVGVIFHELSHRLMCAITGVPAHNIRVKYRNEYSDQPNPHGSITPKQEYQITLLQGFLVAFAPLLFGTWIIYFLIKVAFNSFFDPLMRIIAAIWAISVLLTCSPSRADLSFIKFGYQNDPQHGQYQIFLVILSFIIIWVIVGMYTITFSYEFFYYFLIVFCYIILKYSFISIRIIANKIGHHKGKIPSKVKKRLIKRRFRPEPVRQYYGEYEDKGERR
ncbi:MAG: hypothetical protein ACFFG0_47030 [Candidatus Thorarchaeota archaeon]